MSDPKKKPKQPPTPESPAVKKLAKEEAFAGVKKPKNK